MPHTTQTTSPPRWHYWVVALLPVICLAPFLNKAFHIDDTVYLYIAQHLHLHPIDYFGFQINWHNQPTWVFYFNKNPPFLSYYLATLAFAVGWSEIGMHVAQLIPTIIATLGIFQLAQRFCTRPLLVCAIAVLTPSFIVSTSVLMCEPLMLMFYVWAIVLWMKGLDTQDSRLLAIACVFIGLGTLTKYIGITAIPLLMAYTIARERKLSRTLLLFLIPCGLVALFDLSANALYKGSLLNSVLHLNTTAPDLPAAQIASTKLLNGMSFTGGCYITALFFLPWLHRWRMALAMSLVFVSVIPIALYAPIVRADLVYQASAIQWGFVLQLAVFVTAGVYIFALAIGDLARSRTPESLLLFLLVSGIFIFSCYLNWTINARSLFPMVIAVSLLIVRQLDAQKPGTPIAKHCTVPLLLGALVSFSVGYADYTYAGTARQMAQRIKAQPSIPSQGLWFQGHWGFQYYMEAIGGTHMDWTLFKNSDAQRPKEGDTIVWWVAQYDLDFPTQIRMSNKELVEIPAASWISIMDSNEGSGFYWSSRKPLPYRFGSPKPQKFWVFTVGEDPYYGFDFDSL